MIVTANNPDYHCQLFPTKISFLIFCSYISLFVSQGLLVKAVQRQQISGFNPIVVVLLTELVKLIICVAVYLTRSHSGGLLALIYDIKSNRKLLFLYLVPAFLYCLYNNLTFINLELFDVSTYYCLMQFRIALTAIIYQLLFRRQLNLIQWLSLSILTAGCLLKEYGIYISVSLHNGHQNIHSHREISSNNFTKNQQLLNDNGTTKTTISTIGDENSIDSIVMFLWSTMLLIFQMFCSCFAGVYNEYLLKDSSTAKNADIILQNIFMYFNSIVCNIIVFMFSSTIANFTNKFHPQTPSSPQLQAIELELAKSNNQPPALSTTLYNLLTNSLVIILIFNNALSGLVASFFLKSLNSILKTFASAIELFAVTLLAWLLFNTSVDSYTLIALLLVTIAMFVYSKKPVSVAPPGKESLSQNRDGFMLLPTSEV